MCNVHIEYSTFKFSEKSNSIQFYGIEFRVLRAADRAAQLYEECAEFRH